MRGARVINFAIGIVVIAAFLNVLLLWRAAAEDFGSLDGTLGRRPQSVDRYLGYRSGWLDCSVAPSRGSPTRLVL